MIYRYASIYFYWVSHMRCGEDPLLYVSPSSAILLLILDSHRRLYPHGVNSTAVEYSRSSVKGVLNSCVPCRKINSPLFGLQKDVCRTPDRPQIVPSRTQASIISDLWLTRISRKCGLSSSLARSPVPFNLRPSSPSMGPTLSWPCVARSENSTDNGTSFTCLKKILANKIRSRDSLVIDYCLT